ncbi:uncharacterized protein A4U43_C07F15270 [Asparagus officinalis]|uniref:non-specific serine/threonine protein kinase n=1 Tax=Asparagus officinalis TaxID=4686 RepID=A0A5P1EF31_ASPOF|nr:probable receptor-like protein kinase At1g30570 isoform X1 [Asparagus officinalis]XP_020273069.1 probable receptor-like protein kinase At1g30570 isoform X1 [Asparagus officinalis]XP_020273070.1 probable receptor-like protein kinase At1g30570 isoform X1 [Asparagus officinalis]ONK63449.1 uncharacterized protein A4U43_C07F15270 [Asparagus officinalis]
MWSVATIIGGVIGFLVLLGILIVLLWRRFLEWKSLKNKNSDSGSSNPSTFAFGSNGGAPSGQKGARQFTIEELEQATKNFNESNLVGIGSFGSVYKGLLHDGTVVAIKRRQGAPRHEFVDEVKRLSAICHRNIVTLIGYCQENGLQILVYEYLPNGSISSHLYDSGQSSNTKLEFKQRLSVAIGAAKGLSCLHGLTPPIVHNGFKTSNVLVDENFIAKVADAGIMNLLQRMEGCSLSQALTVSPFQDPEVGELRIVSATSDIYSFGVFLLELISGKETARQIFTGSNGSLAQWVESHLDSNELIDQRLGTNFTSEGMKELVALTLRCLTSSAGGRPEMATVARELDRVLETEMSLTTVMGDGTTLVTLGSQLFSS